ncbi:MAG: RNHCP domain-containing protein [Parcubacteria group bacterium]|nr:RNHCP domain-containing protein [Parcubacteria group bacterium]
MDTKKFQRNVEDFTCENCGSFVKGNGFTNHCPKCLWSKHVDINPGDRAEDCGGLMNPIGVIKKGDSYDIIHQCQKCGFEKKNKFQDGDDFEVLIGLSKDS